MAHVVEHGPIRRCDDADAARVHRQRPLPLLVEQALLQQPLAQPLELQVEDAGALVVDEINDALQFATRLVDRDSAVGDDVRAVL